MNTTINNTSNNNIDSYLNSFQGRTITVPRGNNIGQAVIDDLNKCNLRDKIDIKTIFTERDPINKANVVHLEYKFIH